MEEEEKKERKRSGVVGKREGGREGGGKKTREGDAGEEKGRRGRIEEKYEEAVEGLLRALTAMLLPQHLIW